jgi:hypothetical protein
MLKWIRVGVAVALLTVPALSQAQSSPGDDKAHAPRPEALAACKDKSEGDACAFDAPKGHVDGLCHKMKSGDLVCHHHHPDAGAK